MPVITFEIVQLTHEQKQTIVKEFTDTASQVTGIPREDFYVFVKENSPENVGIGGILLNDK